MRRRVSNDMSGGKVVVGREPSGGLVVETEVDGTADGPVDDTVTDRGTTLVEILMSIVLIGLVVTSILAASHAGIVASSTVYEAGQVETVLLNAGDRVHRAPQRCEYEEYVDAAALAQGWTVDATSSSVELLVANTGNPSADWEAQTCSGSVSAFDVQRVTIIASSPDGKITRTLTVVKSNVD